MITLKSAVAICALGMQLTVSAQEREAEEQAQHEQHLGPSVETPAEPSTMRTHMLAMREQMARIHAAQDPAERQRLMDEHMESMRQHMQMMSETHAGQQRGSAGRCADNDAPCRMDQMQAESRMMRDRMGMMESRMESMQQLMREMMDHMDEAQRPGTNP